MNILIFFIILLILVLIHEAGHFFTAKYFGIRVDEFGFGFPPKLFSLKKGETEYSFNLLPIGGFVRIFGENPNEESISGEDSKRSIINKPKYQQALVLFAGVFANFLLASILFAIVFFIGSPLATDSIPYSAKKNMTENLIILNISKDGPAEKVGMKAGDTIVSIENKEEKLTRPSFEEFVNFSNKPEEILRISFIRDNTLNSVEVMPEKNDLLGRAFVGISPGVLISGKFNFFESLKYGFQTSLITAKDTLFAFGKLFGGGQEAKNVANSIIGPVGLVKVTGIVLDIGIGYLISFMALISISLAVINLIPFPALDGGRLFFLIIEKIKGSRIDSKIANAINAFGFIILLLLMIIVTYRDIF